MVHKAYHSTHFCSVVSESLDKYCSTVPTKRFSKAKIAQSNDVYALDANETPRLSLSFAETLGDLIRSTFFSRRKIKTPLLLLLRRTRVSRAPQLRLRPSRGRRSVGIDWGWRGACISRWTAAKSPRRRRQRRAGQECG